MGTEQKFRLKVLQRNASAAVDAPLTLPSAPTLPEGLPVVTRPVGSGPWRTSSYTIYVDLPDQRDELLLLHSYTGAYDRVSRAVVDYVRSLELRHAPRPLYGTWTPELASAGSEVASPPDDIVARLRKRGYLTTMTREEEESYFCHIAGKLHHISLRERPAYVLMPTYQCNLRCAYCFQDHMRTDPAYRHLLGVITPAMVDRIFRGMATIEAAHGLPADGRGRRITLFGGEPLLREHRPIIEYILRLALVGGDGQISAISNGTDLDAYADLLSPQGISMVQITLDGPPEEHDKRRIYADGSGSFARIARNISLALSRGALVQLRMNIDRHNIVDLPRLVQEFISHGWTDHSGFIPYVAPVAAANENVDAKSTFDSWELKEAMRELCLRYPEVACIGGHDHGMIDQARRLFDGRKDPLPNFRSEFCGAHSTMYVLDSFGDIYACWERTGDPALRIGTIQESGEVHMNSTLLHAWRSRSVTSNVVCRQCRYATYCGGGCAILAEADHGTMFANHCDGFAKRFRAGVAQAYLDHQRGQPMQDRSARLCDQ